MRIPMFDQELLKHP